MFDFEELYEAETAAGAVELLTLHPNAKIIAGGSDVLIQIREGKLSGCTLISIGNIEELKGIGLDSDGGLRIGALTTMSLLTENALINELIPVLAEAAGTVGGPQLRNIATIGGNICNGVTSADCASTLLAFDAVLEYVGPGGLRAVPINEHYTGAGKTALARNEILQAIIIPANSYENCRGCYIKYAMRAAMDIATLGCSANVRLSKNKTTIEQLRLAFGVAGPVPLRAETAEHTASGKPAGEETAAAAAKAALTDINPRTSWRASGEFRLHIAEELAKRTIMESIQRAGTII